MAQNPCPNHIAIIMDGNGRWAKKRGLPRVFGHREGVATVKKIVSHAARKGIKYLSMFAFSAENWLRPQEEVSFLMKLLDEYMATEAKLMMDNNIRFVISGKIDLIPKKTRQTLIDLSNQSSKNTGMILNLLISYGSRDEITDCVKSIAKQVVNGDLNIDDINSEIISKNMYNPILPDVDLLIRTSGECRISNFMLWQISYAELYFTDVLWPDFKEKDFDNAINDFSKRVRRFGKTDEQL